MSFNLKSYLPYNTNSLTNNILSCFAKYMPNSDPIFKENYFNFNLDNYIVLNESCPICLTYFIKYIYITSCGHKFCKRCIKSWLNYSTKCPICRKNIK